MIKEGLSMSSFNRKPLSFASVISFFRRTTQWWLVTNILLDEQQLLKSSKSCLIYFSYVLLGLLFPCQQIGLFSTYVCR